MVWPRVCLPSLLLLPLLLLLLLLLQGRAAEGQVLLQGRCPPIPSKADFDPDRFLGAWNEIERYFVSYEQVAGNCWVENYLFDPDRGYYTRLDWRDKLLGEVRSIENAITFDEEEPGRLFYVLDQPSIPFLNGQYQILETDYTHYALAWQCKDLPLGLAHTEILWLLSKMQIPTPVTIEQAKEVATSLGLDTSLLIKQDRTSCIDDRQG
ncbi:apolipoprotein D-like isoform X2 [Portunus trituberculatus]|nr:apolipoprotein D-like isoform X2 [Portunus trituberculatus]XP_045107020.1 apolipoprotein D-like isoform X2 [Portunus trituberculatus]XP_045107021.1 apolipoprotein D-like isoform X2 [Portunus trituberculatus]